jgi:hypothetical protein
MYACSHETGRGFFEGVRGKEIGLSLFATLLHTLVIRGAGAPRETKSLSENFCMNLEQRRISPRMGSPTFHIGKRRCAL